ncbi:MAG: ATP-dependent DNA helicase RecG [Candidatus Sungbacteria bacterium]|nr:ATP-dependent DNA helicase RecG [Candidatus Sungbacteria bacterium]
MSILDIPIENAPRINRRIIPALRRLGIKTVRDILFHFPSRYEDFSNEKQISEIKIGEIVTISGIIKRTALHRTARKHMALVEAVVSDESGSIKAVWFNQPYLLRNFRIGNALRLSGKIARGPKGVYLQNPAYEKLSATSYQLPAQQSIHTGGLVAIYPETRGITSRWLRFLVKTFIDQRKFIIDPLSTDVRKKHVLPDIQTALKVIHFPQDKKESNQARRRFVFEELFLIQLRALRARALLKQYSAPQIPTNLPLLKEFVASLPFKLTDAQRRSVWEIAKDIEKPRPMNRLLEGDVGSGKTVVAAAAALLAVRAGYKIAFMAPTEILAHQHYDTFQKILEPFDIKIGILTGAKKLAQNADIIVGTHALLHPVRSKTSGASADPILSDRTSNGVKKSARFENLGLVIIDEQHRFGVQQRAALVVRGSALLPHFLSMSATPIPRTLALTIYGDLDLSILDEMPKSRKQVITRIIEPGKRNEAYQFIRSEVKKERQVFVICPRIEPSPTNNPEVEPSVHYGAGESGANKRINESAFRLWEVRAVKDEYKKLSETIFPEFKIGMLHGKLKSKEKEAVMKKFKSGEIDILVSTSVVEVGVDIQNATIMIIEGAERFGLAQLHQFRGRVGRGTDQSYCFLFPTEDGMVTRRLRAVVDARNGFELAEQDLKIRGPGDLFGTEQWGISDTAMAAITDSVLVREVRSAAYDLMREDPLLLLVPELKRKLEEIEKTAHPE